MDAHRDLEPTMFHVAQLANSVAASRAVLGRASAGRTSPHWSLTGLGLFVFESGARVPAMYVE